MKSSATVWIICAFACAPGALCAQNALLVGHTVDFDTEKPIARARVEVVDRAGRRIASAITDSAGAFRFPGLEGGSYRIRAQAANYRDVLTPVVELSDSGTLVVVVRLAVDAIPLAPLEVKARPSGMHRNAALAEFHQRAERALGGVFIMTGEIERRSPRNVTDLLATTPGMVVVGDLLVNQRTQCAPTVYLDGIRLNRLPKSSDGSRKEAFEAANLVPPSALVGIEIHRGAATVPGEFGGSHAGCGVILLWTKRGG